MEVVIVVYVMYVGASHCVFVMYAQLNHYGNLGIMEWYDTVYLCMFVNHWLVMFGMESTLDDKLLMFYYN